MPNISSIRDAEYSGKVQLITGYEYDILGNKTKMLSPGAYGYTESDTANRDKYSVWFSYDALNRLESKHGSIMDRMYTRSSIMIQTETK